MDISAIISLANVSILLALLTVYVKIYKNTRAIFTVGLMFFASMLMLHNLIAEGLLPYFLGVHIAELAGIAALLKVNL